ncbi:DM13 domain-containing protein [Nocardioides salsibiostraticola]
MRKITLTLTVVLVLAVVGLFVLRPWESGGNTQEAIDEALPTTGAAAVPGDGAFTPPPSEDLEVTAKPLVERPTKPSEPTQPAEPTKPPKPEVVELASGEFEDAEYATDGTAKIVRLADGTRILRIENFSTSQAPVIQVAFSNAPSGGAWGSYDDVRFASIGTLKALSGNQNYEIPEGLDLAGFKSVVIWCDKYDVALGTAPVQL